MLDLQANFSAEEDEENSTVMKIITKVSQFIHSLLTAEMEYQKRKIKIRLIEGFSLEKVYSSIDTLKK